MKIGFIGGGKMAEAMISGIIDCKIAANTDIFASDTSEERRKLLANKYKINVFADNISVCKNVEVIVLAVKPQILDAVLTEINSSIFASHLVISIAAGKKLGTIRKHLTNGRVIRVMPNMAVVVREGMCVYCMDNSANNNDRKIVENIFASMGRVVELSEKHFDIVTALSGSGPAFFAYVLSAMVDAASDEGLPRDYALLLAEQTMLGCAKVLLGNAIDPQDLIKAVASPGGTTEAGLKILHSSDMADILKKTLHSASVRSKELSS